MEKEPSMERHSDAGGTNAELLEMLLGRAPRVPMPLKNCPVDTWNEFARELERQDPEAFEILATIFNSGIRMPAIEQEETGGQK